MMASHEWRAKAAEYWEMAVALSDFELSEQYFELAARCLDVAERLEDAAPTHDERGPL
jgi:hypothetical protein